MDVIVAGRGALVPFGVTITTMLWQGVSSLFSKWDASTDTSLLPLRRPRTWLPARFIYFNNHERVQLITGEAPLSRRLSI